MVMSDSRVRLATVVLAGPKFFEASAVQHEHDCNVRRAQKHARRHTQTRVTPPPENIFSFRRFLLTQFGTSGLHVRTCVGPAVTLQLRCSSLPTPWLVWPFPTPWCGLSYSWLSPWQAWTLKTTSNIVARSSPIECKQEKHKAQSLKTMAEVRQHSILPLSAGHKRQRLAHRTPREHIPQHQARSAHLRHDAPQLHMPCRLRPTSPSTLQWCSRTQLAGARLQKVGADISACCVG